MTGLHLVRLPIDDHALTAFAIVNGCADDDRGYALHLALRLRYGAAAPQPFRLMGEGADANVLGYTIDADGLNQAAKLPAIESALDAVFSAAPQLRPMPAEWSDGARYHFDVRVRPVVRFGSRVRAARANSTSWQPQAGEIDAFVAACQAAPTETIDREDVYRHWLARQLGLAASLDDTALVQARRIRTRRSSHGQGRRLVGGPEAMLTGTLTVTDGAGFAALLARGVGRHAAFGFGMLLLAPPKPTPR